MQSAVDSMTRFVQGQGQSLAYAQAIASVSHQTYTEQSAEAYGGPITGGQGGSQFDPSVMPKGPLTFAGSTDAGVNKIIKLLQQQATTESTGIAGLAGSAYATGGIAGALAAIKSAPDTFGADPALNTFQSGGGHSSKIDYTTLLGAQRSTADEKMSAYDQFVQLQNSQTTEKSAQASNLQGEVDFLKTLPTSIARDQKIIDLTNSIQQLKDSTDSLNQTNQDMLSPYYTQDPRTSHIGFRSQGMASGGEFTVPGGYSANDNMIGTIPLASGEIVSVRRPGEGAGGSPISVVNHIHVSGNVDKSTINAIGRTVFQSSQSAAKNLAAAR